MLSVNQVSTSVQSPSSSGAASASTVIVLLANGSANYFLLITEATIQTVSPLSLCWLRRSEVNHEHVAQWQAFSTWQRRRSRIYRGSIVQLRVHQRPQDEIFKEPNLALVDLPGRAARLDIRHRIFFFSSSFYKWTLQTSTHDKLSHSCGRDLICFKIR